VTLTAANGTLTLGGTTGLTFLTGTGTGDPIVTFRGTLADIDAALNNLIFTPMPDFNGDTTLTIGANDLGNTGLGGALTATSTVNLHFNPIDDPPVNSVPATAQQATENAPLFFNFTNGNRITVADVDANGGTEQVTLSVTNGTLTLNGTAGLTFSAGTGTGNAAMTFTGTLSDINTALTGLALRPGHELHRPGDLDPYDERPGQHRRGRPAQCHRHRCHHGEPGQRHTDVSLPGLQTFPEETTLVFSTANGNAISVGDGDAGSNPVQVSLSAADGTLTLASTTNLTFTARNGHE